MNTNQLKKFAQETRRKLLKQVNGKLEHVLNSDNGALRDKAHVVKELKKDLDRFGREVLVDKVAYTWFNRFVALRYMDVRGFQPLEMSILSPQQGQVSPQILQEAMAGHIPDDLRIDRQQIMDILDGRTASSNPENEAYRQLLVASCNHLHSIFPFLFESIDDYTELLLPDDLTSEFSIIHDVTKGMTEEDCQQVEILGWLYQFYISEKKDEVFASKGKVSKEEIPAATQLFTPRWIVEYMVQNTVGKLWVLNNPNSKLKEQMPYYIESEVTAEDVLQTDKPEELTLLDQACGSGHILVYGFELVYKIYEEEGYAPSEIPKLIIEHNLHGFEIDERAAQLAGLAVLMKAREYHRRLFRMSDVPVPNVTCFEDLTLSDEEIKATLKSASAEPSDELLHDLQNMQQATNFGSLIVPHASTQEIHQVKAACKQAVDSADLFDKEKLEQLMVALKTLEKLSVKFCCIVDNPPYMGIRNMNEGLYDYVRNNYSDSKSDLMACFMEAGLVGLKEKGLLGMINQHSWMFLSSYEKLREKLIKNSFIDTLLHLGPRTFPEIGGEVVQNASFTLLKSELEKKGSYIRLVDFGKADLKKTKTIKAIQNHDCGWFYSTQQKDFKKIPGNPIGYWLSENIIDIFESGTEIGKVSAPRQGLATSNNSRFLREWYEPVSSNIKFNAKNHQEAKLSNKRWFPYNKGGSYRKWYGNNEFVVNWENGGEELLEFAASKYGSPTRTIKNIKHYFRQSITWSALASGLSLRINKQGFIFDTKGQCIFSDDLDLLKVLMGYLNSNVSYELMKVLAPTLDFNSGIIAKAPFIQKNNIDHVRINLCINTAKQDWDSKETSWDFQQNEIIRFNKEGGIDTVEDATDLYKQFWTNKFYQLHENEEELNRQFIEIYGLQEELTPDVPLHEITILQEELDGKKLKKIDKQWRGNSKSQITISNGSKPELPFNDKEMIAQFVSYAVGCMFGRYSLDKEGLILANQGETLEDYLEKIEISKQDVSFLPDKDNIIPVLDDEWFEDDIVTRFHQFLKASFGEEYFQKNISFVEEQLGNNLRKYFTKDFYKDHYKRYNKRPIYWKFSSPKGYFNVLIYMHRYTPDTLNNILNNYLREFINKLSTRKEQMQHLENTGSASEKAQASKEIDTINKMIADCQNYEREILYPLASERIEMDLDDGVLVNYNLFGEAVEVISGVNDKTKKKKVKEFDWIDGDRVR